MFTKGILFGMNVLALAGFLVMGLSLILHRTGNAGVPLSIGLLCAGTCSRILRAFCDELVKLTETGAPVCRQLLSIVVENWAERRHPLRSPYSASGCFAG